jgi:hypothetical protein
MSSAIPDKYRDLFSKRVRQSEHADARRPPAGHPGVV